MFKILANVRTWQPLFTADTADSEIAGFELPNDWTDGQLGSFYIRTLASAQDPIRWQGRGRFLVLVTQRRDVLETVADSLTASSLTALKAIVEADRLSTVTEECRSLVEACRTLQKELMNSQPKPPHNPTAGNRTLKSLQFMVTLAGLTLCFLSGILVFQSVRLTTAVERNHAATTDQIHQLSAKQDQLNAALAEVARLVASSSNLLSKLTDQPFDKNELDTTTSPLKSKEAKALGQKIDALDQKFGHLAELVRSNAVPRR